MKTSELLEDAGLGPWFTFTGWAAAARLADAIGRTIQSSIRRAQFAADAADHLARRGPLPFKGLDALIYGMLDMVEDAPPTPGGLTEIWGTLLQRVDPPD